jgi:zinc D-Ala-D-Ala carboxypeptidase
MTGAAFRLVDDSARPAPRAGARVSPLLRATGVTVLAGLVLQALVTPAFAYDWDRRLRRGSRGRDVRALQMRVAGWYRGENKTKFHIDSAFGDQTAKAVKRFERSQGFPNPNGRASWKTFRTLNWLQDKNGSTRHFDWSEFKQHRNGSCSAAANAYAGTFGGGMTSAKRAKRQVKRVMWRLEAVRRKGGRHPVGINSGFRSIPYNRCIGGAERSQHLYGTAADNRVARISNSRARKIARHSQFSGIACYSNTTHNHLDLRIENRAYRRGRYWSWPRRDANRRELDANGSPCWGESSGGYALASTTPHVLESVAKGIPGIGSVIPTVAEVEAFEEAGEPADLGSAD